MQVPVDRTETPGAALNSSWNSGTKSNRYMSTMSAVLKPNKIASHR